MLVAALEQYENGDTLLAELCPRFGKTVWSIALFDHTDNQVMVVCSYVHSVFKSFKKDLVRFTQFENIALASSEAEVKTNAKKGLRSLVLVPLTGPYDSWVDNYGWVNNLKKKMIFVDEADFGAHTKEQVKKVEYLI